MANTHDILRKVIANIHCKPGWHFRFIAGEPALSILVTGPNSRSEGGDITINHTFLAPEATYNYKSWRRWVFNCCRKVEDHELMEWFTDDGERCYAPLHGPGEDPYTIHEFRPETDSRTNQDGSLSPLP